MLSREVMGYELHLAIVFLSAVRRKDREGSKGSRKPVRRPFITPAQAEVKMAWTRVEAVELE